jgi:hypothetical protein
MKKLLITVLLVLFPLSAVAKKNPNVENVKGKVDSIMGNSKLFKIASAIYDKSPELEQGTNFYTLVLKIKKNAGEATMTFRKDPEQKSASQDISKLVPEYQTVTFKVIKYIDKVVPMEKETSLNLPLKESQTIAVYQGQKLTLNWLGDGWGTKGFHLYAYQEKLTK